MIPEWNEVDFKFGLEKTPYDIAVTEYGSRMGLMDILKGREAAQESLSENFKKLKKDDESDEPKLVSIAYEGKGGLGAVILNGNGKPYFVQEALRKQFAGVLTLEEENRSVNVWLRGLKDTEAKIILSWVASLAVLSRFRAENYGKKNKEQKAMGKLTLYFQTSLPKKVAEEIIEEARILAFANNQVRYLADLPSNFLTPKTYAAKAEKMAKELKVDFEFLDKKQLTKLGAGAFLAVSQADLNDRAGIAHLHYRGNKKSKKSVALVGKGICFDTGGYNIKTGDFMLNMHRDMTGSAVALSLFRAMVELEVPYEVHCYLALAENLISHEGFRPNDVVIASNGMSIEVVDTDAEGRMVLSDTLAIASEQKPDFILDFATLTGAVVRSIDTRRCGAFSNDLKISQLAVQVGERCGERVWNFPIGDDYQDSIKSDIADVRQCAVSNCADHIYAATFLSKFVGKKIPWVHIDLAADTNKGGLGLVATETTGFGVRFGLNLVREVLGD